MFSSKQIRRQTHRVSATGAATSTREKLVEAAGHVFAEHGERRAELEDLKLQVEADIRKIYLDLQAATSEVEVAEKNAQLAKETLDLTRQRVEAGVADSVELVQSQEALAGAELDYINSVFSHNVAKLSLARSMGRAAENLPKVLSTP